MEPMISIFYIAPAFIHFLRKSCVHVTEPFDSCHRTLGFHRTHFGKLWVRKSLLLLVEHVEVIYNLSEMLNFNSWSLIYDSDMIRMLQKDISFHPINSAYYSMYRITLICHMFCISIYYLCFHYRLCRLYCRFSQAQSILWLQSVFFSFLQCIFISHPIIVNILNKDIIALYYDFCVNLSVWMKL